MSTWNNRIVRHKSPSGDWYAMHEVYYGDDGKVWGWTMQHTKPYGETIEELISSLEQMIMDAQRFKDDVIDYDSEPAGKIEDLMTQEEVDELLAQQESEL